MTAPLPRHLLLGDPRHGVTEQARLISGELGATSGAIGTGEGPPGEPLHLHVTDRLLPDGWERWLADLVARHRVTLTLHDVPQPTDGAAFDRRRAVYRRLIELADGWVVGSEHERATIATHLGTEAGVAGHVIPLPVVPTAPGVAPGPGGPLTAVMFGWVYPGKGHRELIDAAARVRRHDRSLELRVVAAGAPAPGHTDDVERLCAHARRLDVDLEVTGWLDDAAAAEWLERATVGVCGHRNVSASASQNSWVAAGRRPLVRDGAYAREMEALRPGCHVLFDDDDLPDALLTALRRPATTRLPPGHDTRPHLADTAAAYRRWWDSR